MEKFLRKNPECHQGQYNRMRRFKFILYYHQYLFAKYRNRIIIIINSSIYRISISLWVHIPLCDIAGLLPPFFIHQQNAKSFDCYNILLLLRKCSIYWIGMRTCINIVSCPEHCITQRMTIIYIILREDTSYSAFMPSS